MNKGLACSTAVLLGSVAASACQEAEPLRECPEGTVAGHRLLARSGEGLVPVFDSDSLPAGDFDSVELNVQLVGSDAPNEPPRPAWLRVAPTSAKACRLDILWGETPAESPGVSATASLRKAGLLDRAERVADTAWKEARPWDRLWLSVEKARNAAARNDLRAAKRAWLVGVKIAESLSLSSEVARRLLAASFYALKIDDLTEALELANRARDLATTVEDLRLEGLAAYHRGLVLEQVGDVYGAVRSMQVALDSLERITAPTDTSAVYRALAVLYSSVGRDRDARKAIEAAANLFDESSPRAVWAQFLNDWAVILCAEHANPTESTLSRCRDLLSEATEIASELELEQEERLYRTNLADYELQLGRPKAALRSCELAREVGSSDWFAESTLLINEAEALFALGRYEEAKSKYTQLLTRAERDSGGQPSEYTWRAIHGLGRVSEKLASPEVAMAEYERALTERRLAANRAGLSFSRGTILARGSQLVEDALRLALSLGDVEKAFEIAEAAQSEVLRGLNADVRRSRLDEGQQAELVRRLEAYRRARAALEASTSELEQADGREWYEATVERREARLALSEQFDDFYAWLDRVAPAPTLESATVDELQSLLARDEAVLTFAPIGDRWISFLITPLVARHAFLDPADHPLSPWRNALLGTNHLYVAPGAYAKASTIHRMSVPGSDELVYSRFSVSYLPYAGLLETSCSRSRGAPVVVADPEGNLPFARKEAKSVVERLPEPLFLAGGASTHSAVVEAIGNTRLFHFAGHGRVTPANPWDAHLQLADGARLTLEDVLMIQPRVGMAVLNACETAVETDLSRRESIGLAGALLVLGTCSVVATDAVIADADAAAFIRSFYTKNGLESPAEAVRLVSREWNERRRSESTGTEDAENEVQPWMLFRVLGRR